MPPVLGPSADGADGSVGARRDAAPDDETGGHRDAGASDATASPPSSDATPGDGGDGGAGDATPVDGPLLLVDAGVSDAHR
jgi:hypothetical protein